MDLRDFLVERLELFKSMKAAAEDQKALLMKADVKDFMDLYAHREVLQHRIDLQEKKVEVVPAADRDGQRDRKIRSIREEIAEVIRAIRSIDREVETLVRKERKRILDEVKDLRHGQRALKGYGGRTAKPPKFVSTKS
jgi:hypothetical protein